MSIVAPAGIPSQKPGSLARFPKKQKNNPIIFFNSKVYIFDRIYYNELVKRDVVPKASPRGAEHARKEHWQT